MSVNVPAVAYVGKMQRTLKRNRTHQQLRALGPTDNGVAGRVMLARRATTTWTVEDLQAVDRDLSPPELKGRQSTRSSSELDLMAKHQYRRKAAGKALGLLVRWTCALVCLRYPLVIKDICYFLGLGEAGLHVTISLLWCALLNSMSKAIVVTAHELYNMLQGVLKGKRHLIYWFDRLSPCVVPTTLAVYCRRLSYLLPVKDEEEPEGATSAVEVTQCLAAFFSAFTVLLAVRLSAVHIYVLSAAKQLYEEDAIKSNAIRTGLSRLAWHCDDVDETSLKKLRYRPLASEVAKSTAFRRLANAVRFQSVFDRSLVSHNMSMKKRGGLEMLSQLDSTFLVLCFKHQNISWRCEAESKVLFNRLLGQSDDIEDSALDFEPPLLTKERIDEFFTSRDAQLIWRQLGGEAPSLNQEEFAQAVTKFLSDFYTTASAIGDFYSIQEGIIGTISRYLQWAILGVLFLKLFAPDWAHSLGLFCSSLLLGGSFVFGASLREMYESIIVVTVLRPFDVGDRVEVKGTELIITRIRLLTTEAITSTNQVVMLKNAALYHCDALRNFRRSPNATIEIEAFIIAASATPAAMAKMEEFLQQYLLDHADSWEPSFLLSYVAMHDGIIQVKERLEQRYRVRHLRPWQEKTTIRRDAATLVYAFLEEARRLNLDVSLPERPIRLGPDQQDLLSADLASPKDRSESR